METYTFSLFWSSVSGSYKNCQFNTYKVMKLLKFENYQVTISDEAMLVKQFRVLFNADKTKNKEHFYKQMTILFFMTDPRSNYAEIIDEDERLKTILEHQGYETDFVIDAKLHDAMEVYRKLTVTTSARILQDMRESLDSLRKMMKIQNPDQLDLEDKLKASNMIANINSKLPKLAKDLMETEKIVNKEIEEVGRARGGNESKKAFEDGI